MKKRRVFISYAHESDEYRNSIKELADWLSGKGVSVITDHKHEVKPPEKGWQVWMKNEIEQADIVLVACTQLYYKRFWKKEEPGKGKGAIWEGAIIAQELYESQLKNKKFYPIVPDGGSTEYIPEVLKSYNNYWPFPSGYEKILRLIHADNTEQKKDIPVSRGVPKAQIQGAGDTRLEPKRKKVYGRKKEIVEVKKFLAGTERMVSVSGTGGIGKSEVCKAAPKEWIKAGGQTPVFFITFTSASSGLDALPHFAKEMGIENAVSFEDVRPCLNEGIYYLDNSETIAEDTEGIAFLTELAACPGIRILTSSRANIGMVSRDIPIQELPLDVAIVLFREIWKGRELTDESKLSEFVNRELGRHALTIVLVAALGEGFSLDDIIAKQLV